MTCHCDSHKSREKYHGAVCQIAKHPAGACNEKQSRLLRCLMLDLGFIKMVIVSEELFYNLFVWKLVDQG